LRAVDRTQRFAILASVGGEGPRKPTMGETKMKRYVSGLVIAGVMVLTGCETFQGTATSPQTGDSITAAPKLKPGRTKKWTFDKEAVGKLAVGWECRETKPSKGLATWQVVADKKAASAPNVFALTKTESERKTFNLAIFNQVACKDLDLTVKVKGNTGKIDQGGGPIWRCQNANNYYVCRINPLEDNYRVYKVINGSRKKLASANVDLEAGKWYTLRVTMAGDQITCYLDGEKLLEAGDGALPEAGKIGLWTKADAASAFDDLEVTAAKP